MPAHKVAELIARFIDASGTLMAIRTCGVWDPRNSPGQVIVIIDR
jgi:hypothetical protein